MSTGFVRTPPPRQLGSAETLETLTHWRTTFKTFFKRDETYKVFVKDEATWDPSAPNYNQAAEEAGLQRSPEAMMEDLVDILNILSGFLPHSYLTDKIVRNTKNWKDVWNIIHDHYGVQVTSESLLDFESMHKQTGETHRQFYERLLQHVKQHLAPAGVKVEQLTTTSADKMSVSMMNMVALQWLRKIDQSLIKIVRTEYSKELRNNIQLADLVPRISLNIDSLLTRYNQVVTSNKIQADEAVDMVNVSKTFNQPPQGRVGKGRGEQPPQGRNFNRGGAQGRGALGGGRTGGPFCPGCYYLSHQLGTSIHFKHVPSDCPRKAVTVKMLEMEDLEYFDDAAEDEECVSIGKISAQMNSAKEKANLQAVTSTKNPPAVMNININIGSSSNDHDTVFQSVKPVNIPQSVGNVQNVDISDKIQADEDKSTCKIDHVATLPVQPSRSHHDEWTGAGS